MKPTLYSPTPLVSRLEALADPARLRMLHLLSAEELAVSELADVLQMPQSSVSRHLKLLAEQGWVVSRGERTANFYRMANGELPEPARRLWELAAGETQGWAALEHDRLRLARTLAAREEKSGDARAFSPASWSAVSRPMPTVAPVSSTRIPSKVIARDPSADRRAASP